MSGTGGLHWIPEKRKMAKTEQSFLCVMIHKINFMFTKTHWMTLKMSSAGNILHRWFHKRCINLSRCRIWSANLFENISFFSTSVSLHILSHVPVACEEIGHTSYYLGRPYAQTLLLWKTNPTLEVWGIHRQAEKYLSLPCLKIESQVWNDPVDSLLLIIVNYGCGRLHSHMH